MTGTSLTIGALMFNFSITIPNSVLLGLIFIDLSSTKFLKPCFSTGTFLETSISYLVPVRKLLNIYLI